MTKFFGCQLLEWDTDFFGVRIARFAPTQPSAQEFHEADVWCLAHGVRCLYWLCDADYPEGVRLAEAYHYALVDIRVTLDASLQEEGKRSVRLSDSGRVRQWRPEDLVALKALVAKSFTASRFYTDGHFTPERVGRLYEIWLEKSCTSDSSLVLVAEASGRPAGLMTCDFPDEGRGQIGLFAVDSNVRGTGIAKQLLLAGMETFRQEGVKKVEVVTQGRNIGAQRLYLSCGFATRAVQLWYHKWLPLQ